MAGSEYYDDDRISINHATPQQWDAAAKNLQETQGSNDPVNNPSHYNTGSIETIDYIVDVLGPFDAIHYCHGNVLKYLGTRLWTKNNPKQDAQKAKWYLNKMIELMEQTKGENW